MVLVLEIRRPIVTKVIIMISKGVVCSVNDGCVVCVIFFPSQVSLQVCVCFPSIVARSSKA